MLRAKVRKILLEDIKSGKESKFPLVIGVSKLARKIANKAEDEGVELLEKPVNLAIEKIKSEKYELFETEPF